MADLQRRTAQLARRLEGIRDPTVRVRYLQSLLRQRPPKEIALVLSLAVHRTEARDHASAKLLLALCLALADEQLAEERALIAAEARALGHHHTAALLTRRASSRTASDAAFPVPDFGRGRSLTLGERKSLARARNRGLLDRVLRDPHPAVIRIVLDNPTLTEPDVVRVCSRRPVLEEVVREVFRNPRWILRYGVRRAMVRNPFTPVDVALQLVLHLTVPDAADVAASAEVDPVVRAACERLARRPTLH